MVKVPTQPTQRVQVEAAPAVFQSSDVPSGAFDSGAKDLIAAGKQIEGFSDTLSKTALQMQVDDNEAEIKEKDILISEAIRAAMYGDNTTENVGYYGLKQKDALTGYGVAEDALAKAIGEIEDGSSNPAVKSKVGEMGAVRFQRELNSMTKYAAGERVNYLNATGDARIAQAASNAATAWNNPAVMTVATMDVTNEVEDYAERNGLSEDAKDTLMANRMSVVVKGAFDAALANDAVGVAEQLLADHKDKLDGVIRASMEKDLKTQGVAVRGQALADAARIKFPNELKKQREYIRKNAKGMTERAAIGEVKEIEAEAWREAQHKNTMDEQGRTEELRTARAMQGSFLYDEQAATPRTVRQFRVEHPKEFDILSRAGEIERFQKEARKVAEGQLFANATDGETLRNLREMDEAELAEVNLDAYRTQLTKKEFDKASVLVGGARKRVRTTKANQPIYSVGESVLRDFAPKSLNMGRAKQTNRQKLQFQAAITEMNSFISGVIEDTKKKPTRDEITKEAVRLMLKVNSDPDGFWDDDVQTFAGIAAQAKEMSKQQRGTATVEFDNIPLQLLEFITTTAKAYGIEKLDRDVVQEVAGAWAMNDKARVDKLLTDAARK